MKAKLKIKNFGPLKDIDIEIKKYNILIGPQGAGKSTIAKVLCIIHFFDYGFLTAYNEKRSVEFLNHFLVYYNVESFLHPHSWWYFEDEDFIFELKLGKVRLAPKKDPGIDGIKTNSYYFPAERIALPMISESLFELTMEQSSLPGYFLQFGKDFTIARKQQQLFHLPILDIDYEHKGGKSYITFRDSKTFPLEMTSSAIQSLAPLLVILQYPINLASLFVIEELELHNFPKLQKELLYYIIERMKHPKLEKAYLILPTHSPYLLSTANNLLFASKVASEGNEEAVNQIISKRSWINTNDFTAFYISGGNARLIIDQSTGLIDENELDGISEDLAGEFDQLMALYKPATA